MGTRPVTGSPGPGLSRPADAVIRDKSATEPRHTTLRFGDMSTHPVPEPALPARKRHAHRATVSVDISLIARYLVESLGTGLVGLLAGVDRRTAQRWAADQATAPRADSERRLRDAYQVFQELLPVEASATIRAWFMGMNPELDDVSPSEAIAADKGREVLAAARAFASGG